MNEPCIAITAGDPCGIGPEIILKALGTRRAPRGVRLVVIGDRAVFARAAKRLGRRLPSDFIDCGNPGTFVPGRTSASAGRAALSYLERALQLWRRGALQGLVTAPLTKWAVQRAQPSFIGHTEWLAQATGARQVVMLFAAERLRVAVLTRHIPLRRVPASVTPARLAAALRLLARELSSQFDIRRPRLAVCGVNPHAGEGRAGSEESRIIEPVIRRLRREGIRCEGPFAADGFFAQPVAHDAVLCAYHDQGLIPFKMAARDHGCQVTLGLPLVRTSPDHGSALDIAGQGRADTGSMRYALSLAIRLVRRRMR